MDTITIIAVMLAACGLVAMAWLGGYELGHASGTDAERELANRRVNSLLEQMNKIKPRGLARNRRTRK
jgi:hypothetical protein